MTERYTIGLDFGTLSGRAVLVRVSDGAEIGSSVYVYENGVMDEALPDGTPLPPDFALQDPADYLRTLERTIPQVISESGIPAEAVIGLGVDFTACTVLPTRVDGTPLCLLKEFQGNPHSWVKLWKHHAAQEEANRINAMAKERGEAWLPEYGGKTSSEWFLAKAWQILNEAPQIYAEAERILEAADWVVWQLTGKEMRNACAAGYKALWSRERGYPSREFLRSLDPRLEGLVGEKMMQEVAPPGRAGVIRPEMAKRLGLSAGVAVAVGQIDAHAGVPAATVVEPGKMVMVMGTSTCHMVLSPEKRTVEGMCGVVWEGIIPGYYGYEAGQAAVGDIFGWFVQQATPQEYRQEAEAQGISLHQYLEALASVLKPGESGLLALDWWNGNRSILVDADLTGLILGLTLTTKPEEIYRALLEATAFGTRVIIEAFESQGIAIHELYACGGLPKNQLLMQIYADVTGRCIKLARSAMGPALGAAMWAAVAAGPEQGGYPDILTAAQGMAHISEQTYHPNPEAVRVYERLYTEYLRLMEVFRGEDSVMKRVKSIRTEVLS